MQDRFKYRFFDVEDEKMYDVKNICFVGEPTVTVAYKPVIKKAIYRGYLIQCTSLKDKNGRLIYEGDIVKDLIIPEIFYIVKWFNSGFYLESTISGSFLKFNDTQQEVIGNIYENPELLSEVEE